MIQEGDENGNEQRNHENEESNIGLGLTIF